MKNNRTNIKEVARAAGVSTQTISRVLNNRPDVSPDTRRRVLALIAELDYRPSALARSLIQQRSYTLGVVTSGLQYAGIARSLNGITARAEALGYSLLLKELPDFSTPDVQPVVQALMAHHVDGLVWAVPEVGANRDWLDGLEKLPLPAVFLSMAARPGVAVVTVDNYAGAAAAVRHLLQRGRCRIGHIAGPQDWWEGRMRRQGWYDTLGAAGLPAEEAQWVEGNWSAASGAEAAGRLFEQFPQMDAVFAANDQMALALLQAAARRGLAVPQDLAVVGFDDLPEAAYFSPALTSVLQDQQAAGRMAVELLVGQLEAGEDDAAPPPAFVCIQPTLIVRESS